ncbi:hypothetical protein [Oceanihabitans sediminis]|uniref:Magnesium citrate secondary transporter n=1 Tax=Oceanihabitans sediminis TaxID=1812012 RepID=A0A368P6U3_9FLAO|nr:hypothetical protein [Oceanihabitans sediminis]MDX1277487.1 hypothetical protein [Oceanihabitans sediminis]MDX1772828.1 hypothetical protein [Oceanihabitans sediminis]RBP34506.1 hypothetical protein DFR65_101400 [Oceanihabitans sediminis]RCU58176.1 hypothetical protein DU428_01985 [Oceanihabitans sediminis]
MRILKHPIFYLSVLIATIIYILQRLEVPIPNWINFYVNDFLCMPIVLSLCLAVLRIFKKTETLYVPLFVVLALTSYFAVYFEWLMPKVNSRYTRDILDIGLYFLGGLLFYRFQKKLF